MSQRSRSAQPQAQQRSSGSRPSREGGSRRR
jgi:hypothetical protein